MAERNRIMAIVAGPLMVLLAVLSILDFIRLRSDFVDRRQALLLESARAACDGLDARLASAPRATRILAEVLETSVGLDDAALYGLLARTLKAEPDLASLSIVFPPGSRNAGAFGPESTPDLPEVELPAPPGDRIGPRWFAPTVLRTEEGLARCDAAETAAGMAQLARAQTSADRWGWLGLAESVATGAPLAHLMNTRAGEMHAFVSAEVERTSVEGAAPSPGIALSVIDQLSGSPVLIEPAGAGSAVKPSDDLLSARAPARTLGLGILATSSRAEVMRLVYREFRQRLLAAGVVVLVLVAAAGTLGPLALRPWRRIVGERGEPRLDLGRGGPDTNGPVTPVAALAAALPLTRALTPPGLSTDDAIARSIQASQLQTVFPSRPEFDLFALAVPALRVGGDFYDFFSVGKETLAIAIADVAGKGVGAAMFMSATRTLVRELALVDGGGESPGRVLTRVNTLLLDTNPELLFVTTFLGFYNVRTGVLLWSNAGHPPPLVIRAASRGPVVEPLGRATGTVMGALPGLVYEDREAMLQWGDRLVLYTDGVSEATSPSGVMWGVEGLSGLCREKAALRCEALCREVMLAVDLFQHGNPHDDATIMALQRLNR